jgi:hypothetical protein
LASAEYLEPVRLLRLKPGLTRYEVTLSTVGFIKKKAGAPVSESINIVPRSHVQVTYYISHGVEVPPDHLRRGVAKPTLESDGSLFDWRQVTNGLFSVKAVCQTKRPECAAVAVRHRGYWFDIEDADQSSKSTLNLLRPARRLDLDAFAGDRRPPSGPTLTLPVGR